jgi:hypothetical protein
VRNISNFSFSFPDGPERPEHLLWSDCPILHGFTGFAAWRMELACHGVSGIRPDIETCKRKLTGFFLECSCELNDLHLYDLVLHLLSNPESDRYPSMRIWLKNGWDDDGAAMVELMHRILLNRKIIGAAIALRSIAISADSDDSVRITAHSRG